MQYSYRKTKEELKTVISDEIKSHKKYEVYNEITGGINGDKVHLSVESEIPATTGTFFKSYFYGKITETGEGCALKGSFHMKPLSLALLAVLFIVCVCTIVFNILMKNAFSDMLAAIVILAAELALLVFQYIYTKKEKRIIESFLRSS